MAEAKEHNPPLSHKRTQLEEDIDDSGTMTCTSPYTTPVNEIDENDEENPPSNNNNTEDPENEEDSNDGKSNGSNSGDGDGDDDKDEEEASFWAFLAPYEERYQHFGMVFSYKLDNFISVRINQFYLVAIAMVLCILIFAPLFHIWVQDEYFDPRYYMDERQNETIPFEETFWEVYTFLMDPGAHVEIEQPGARIFGAVIAWSGVVIFSILIGFIIDAVMDKMEDLKKGKSTVVEEEHTLILGWTDKSAGLCREIALANESEGGGVIVVLDPLDKEELEAIYKNQVKKEEMAPDGNVTKVVFRSGSPLRGTDLQRVSATKARAIIILSDYNQEPDLADADILRVVLTLQTLDRGELNGHVVCEVRDVDNEPLVAMVGGDLVETVVSHDVIGRLMLMAARQPGIARVFDSLLGFDGDEFYTEEWPELYGLEFQDAMMRFPDAIPIGYSTGDGDVELNPDKSHIMNIGEEIIVIAEDDDTYKPEIPLHVEVSTTIDPVIPMGDPEKILFCGWRRDVRDMMLHLDSMLAPGSELHMLNEKPADPKVRTKLLLDDGFNPKELKNMSIVHWYGNSAIKRHLEEVPLDDFSTIMILADQSRENDMMHSDSHSLSSLLLIREMQDLKRAAKRKQLMQGSKSLADRLAEWNKAKEFKCAIVCEILDTRTQETISGNEKVSLSSDFVQSNKMISQALAMVSEDRNVKHILSQLLGPHGADVMVKSSRIFCQPHEELSFMQLQKRALRLDKILLGYQGHLGNEETVVNPKDKYTIKTWDAIDIVYMEGHSELHKTEEDKAEIVLEAFQYVAKKSTPQSVDKTTVSQKLMASLKSKKMDVRPELDGAGGGGEGKEPRNTGRSLLVTGETDSKVLELLIAMNAKMVNLEEKVDDMQSKLNNIDASSSSSTTGSTGTGSTV